MSLEYPFLLNVSKYLENSDNIILNKIKPLGQKINFNPICFEIMFSFQPIEVRFVPTINYPKFNINDFDCYESIYCSINMFDEVHMLEYNKAIRLIVQLFPNKKMNFKINLLTITFNLEKIQNIINEFPKHDFKFYIIDSKSEKQYLFIDSYHNIRVSTNTLTNQFESCIGFVNIIVYYDVLYVDYFLISLPIKIVIQNLIGVDDKISLSYHHIDAENCDIVIKNNIIPYCKITCRNLDLPNCETLNAILNCKHINKPKLNRYNPLLIIDNPTLREFYVYAFNIRIFNYKQINIINRTIHNKGHIITIIKLLNNIQMLRNYAEESGYNMIIATLKLKQIKDILLFKYCYVDLIMKDSNNDYKYDIDSELFIEIPYDWLNYYNEFLKLFNIDEFYIDISTLMVEQEYKMIV